MAMATSSLPVPVRDHGGRLAAARALFPGAPEPWVDLSTGINPTPYPLPALPASAWTRLPEGADEVALRTAAARAYGAPSEDCIVAAPGTQILLPLVMGLVRPGRAAVLSPTYAEHARAAALAGHRVSETGDFSALFDADVAVVVNPNNPDGRVTPRSDLSALAAHLRAKGGLLVVDEAFMDVGPRENALDPDVAEGGVVVLRSFGKFFGLAGLRLGFALTAPSLAGRLAANLGPWAVHGPALAVGTAALADLAWQAAMRAELAERCREVDALLAMAGLRLCGGTSLFRYVEVPEAQRAFEALARCGILTRTFTFRTDVLRLGLPASGHETARLRAALEACFRPVTAMPDPAPSPDLP